MRTLTVDLDDRSYPIYIGRGIRQQKELFDDAIHGKQVMIVTNDTVAPLYLDAMVSLLSADYKVDTCILPDGEVYKRHASLIRRRGKSCHITNNTAAECNHRCRAVVFCFK